MVDNPSTWGEIIGYSAFGALALMGVGTMIWYERSIRRSSIENLNYVRDHFRPDLNIGELIDQYHRLDGFVSRDKETREQARQLQAGIEDALKPAIEREVTESLRSATITRDMELSELSETYRRLYC